MGCTSSSPASEESAAPAVAVNKKPEATKPPPPHATTSQKEEKKHVPKGDASGAKMASGAKGATAPHAAKVNRVLNRETGALTEKYTLGKELGRGQFGIAYVCVKNDTGEKFACKTIAKTKLQSQQDIDDLKREIEVMYVLAGHTNIVQIRDVYEDRGHIHLVMDICEGGELFDRIVAKGHYSQKAAAGLMRTMIKVVMHCHQMGVIHRDLKPENFLLDSKLDNARLKATDFGLSVFFHPGQTFSDVVGSAYYVAPEVLRQTYGPEADVWSCGVILYILLCGVPPFWHETEQGIFEAVLRGHLDFSSPAWRTVSPSAIDCIKRLLTMDPKKRMTAREALDHPWMREDGEATDDLIDTAVVDRLKNFANMTKMKKLAALTMAKTLSPEEIKGLKNLFMSFDTDNSGTITLDELKAGLKNYEGDGAKVVETELVHLMENMGLDGSGSITYDEFIAATLNMSKLQTEDSLLKTFNQIDVDGSGTITKDELVHALKNAGMDYDPKTVDEIMTNADKNGDGLIQYEEFLDAMRETDHSRMTMKAAKGMHMSPF